MKTRTMEAAIGIALFVATLILIVGLIWLSEQTVGWRNYELTIAFRSAEGLKRGDAVNLVGIKIGRVDRLDFRNARAEAHVFLGTDYKLPRNSQFFLESGGLITGKVINIVPGNSNDYLVDGDVVEGEVVGGLEDLGPVVSSLETRVRATVDTLLGTENINRIQAMVRHLQATTSTLEAILAQNRQNIELTMANLQSGSDHLRSLLNHNSSRIDSALANLATTSAQLDAVSRDLATTTTTLKGMSRAIEERQGTLGALIYERDLYNNLTSAAQNLNTLIEDIKKHPQKYVKVSVF
ncbi:MAG: MlaD family protein [candidate division KSB1 bacterium]|nr:MlaD family protein [candidate division KSB1 bacterium]MDZ7304129.1 MlaD family protein [candidate division KSB1 bacterium]MDZ7314084.1 MlaD family protein [candidate division KSB1 bacterium]